MKIQRVLFMLTKVNLALLLFQLTVPKANVPHRSRSSFSTALKPWTFTSLYCINHQVLGACDCSDDCRAMQRRRTLLEWALAGQDGRRHRAYAW